MTEALKGQAPLNINPVIDCLNEEEWQQIVKVYPYTTPVKQSRLLSAVESPILSQALIVHYYSQAHQPNFLTHWLSLSTAIRATASRAFYQLIELFPENLKEELANHAKENLNEFGKFLLRLQKTYDPFLIHKFLTPLIHFYTRKDALNLIHHSFKKNPELFFTLFYTIHLTLLTEVTETSLYLQPVYKVSPLEFRTFYFLLDEAKINFLLSLKFGTFGFREPPVLDQVVTYLHTNYSQTQFIGTDEEKVLHSIPPILCPMLLLERHYNRVIPFLNRLTATQITSLGCTLQTANSLGYLTSLREHFLLDNFALLVKSLPIESLTPFLEEENRKREAQLHTLLSVKNPTLNEIVAGEQFILNISKNSVEKVITSKLEELSGQAVIREFNKKLERLQKKCEAYRLTLKIEKKRVFEKSPLIKDSDAAIGIRDDGDLEPIFKKAVNLDQREFLLQVYRSQPDLQVIWKKFRQHHINSLKELIEMEIPKTEVFKLQLVAEEFREL